MKGTFLLMVSAMVAILSINSVHGKCFGNNWKKRDEGCRGPLYQTRHSYPMSKNGQKNYCCDNAPNTQCWFNDWKSRDKSCQGARYNYRYSYKSAREQSIFVGTKYCCSDPIVKGPTCFHNDWQARDKACSGARYNKRYSVPATYAVPYFLGYGMNMAVGNGRYYCCHP